MSFCEAFRNSTLATVRRLDLGANSDEEAPPEEQALGEAGPVESIDEDEEEL